MPSPRGGGGLVVFGRDAVLGEPAEDVAHAALAGLVAPEPVHDSAVHHTAHAGHFAQLGSVHDVAGGGAHDGHELARLHGPGGRGGDVGVDIADGDGDALRQSGPGGGLGGQVAGGVAQPADGVLELGADEVLELRVQGGQEVLGRVAAVLVDPLVAGRAGVADVVAAELPDDPVGGLHPVVHRGVGFRVFLEQLQAFGEFPFGGDQPAIAREPGLAPFGGQRVDPVRLRLRGVVAPQLHVGVRPVGEAGQLHSAGCRPP